MSWAVFAIFGVGTVAYGYCPGTGIAAIATVCVHALVGFAIER